jgi:phenylalanyl-tRNA synthetase beta chain
VFAPPSLKAIPVFPSVTRDLALVVDEGVKHEEIVGVIRQNACPELTTVDLFDIFRGEGIGRGRKSLAYSLVYRSSDRTLTDEEANGFHEAIKGKLKSELGVEIRDK